MALLGLIKLRTAYKTVAMFMCYVHTEDKPVLKASELVASRSQVNARERRTELVKKRLLKPTSYGLYPNEYNIYWEIQSAVLEGPSKKDFREFTINVQRGMHIVQ